MGRSSPRFVHHNPQISNAWFSRLQLLCGTAFASVLNIFYHIAVIRKYFAHYARFFIFGHQLLVNPNCGVGLLQFPSWTLFTIFFSLRLMLSFFPVSAISQTLDSLSFQRCNYTNFLSLRSSSFTTSTKYFHLLDNMSFLQLLFIPAS